MYNLVDTIKSSLFALARHTNLLLSDISSFPQEAYRVFASPSGSGFPSAADPLSSPPLFSDQAHFGTVSMEGNKTFDRARQKPSAHQPPETQSV